VLSIDGLVIRSGLRVGVARRIKAQVWDVAPRRIDPAELEKEYQALNDALAHIEAEIDLHLRQFQGPDSDREILKSHLLILRDPELLKQVKSAVSDNLESAAQAVQRVFAGITRSFRNMPNDFFAQRASDYSDVGHRLLAALTGQEQEDLADWQPGQIAVLNEATPSQVSAFARHNIPAYCAQQGSFTSHASILTRSLNIPAVVALPGLYDKVQDGDALILDAIDGKVIIAPDQPTLLLYAELLEKYREQESQEQKLSSLPVQTAAGRQISLRCNLDLLTDLDQPARLGAAGIGLYRTEFLYLGKDELPPEDLQYQIYRQVAEKVAPHSVILRTFDLGGDKLSHLIPAAPEANPYLGCRGIRFSLAYPEIFRVQIRAVLRAGLHGRIQLMFPMVADLKDFLAAQKIVEDCRAELLAEGVECSSELPLGVMIEIPSAALCAEELARHCDFMSIGTNDLVQYTLATDRNNSALTPYYVTHHPAVVQLLKTTLAAGRKYGKPVSICGEMASQPEYLPLLIGLGFTDLSVNPASFLPCKRIILRCDAALDDLCQNAGATCSLAALEELIYQKLKPYYHP
jgi:phosphotransferase system enzyme I (PtsI)